MTRRKKSLPALCQHKASGQADVRLNGRDYYLGPWKGKTAPRTVQDEYDRLVSEWLENGRQLPADKNAGAFKINELIVLDVKHAEVMKKRKQATSCFFVVRARFAPVRDGAPRGGVRRIQRGRGETAIDGRLIRRRDPNRE